MEIRSNDNILALYNAQKQASQLRLSNDVAQKNAPIKSKKETHTHEIPTKKQEICTFAGSVLGVAAGLMLLAKFDKNKKYTINPLKMIKGKIKDSYFMNANYKTKEVMTLGAGSVIGGLIGGAVSDDKENRNAKVREAIIQYTNISLPIAFVELFSNGGSFLSKKVMPGWDKSISKLRRSASKLPIAASSVVGLMSGMYVGNKVSNKLNEKIFHKKDDRPVKMMDFSAHIDDLCFAATFIAENNPLTNVISRLIPAALLIAGNETGTKKENK